MKKYWFAISVIIAMFIVSALLYSSLPDQIPTHFGMDGTIDKYDHKIMIFSLPTIILVLTILLIIFPKLDPRKENYRRFSKTYLMLINIFILFMTGIFGITVYSSYYPNTLNIAMIIPLALGLFFSVIGNMMPKFRWNYFVGIRCPWTLQNEQVWFLTHQLGGKLWMSGGLLIMLCAFFPPSITIVCMTTILGVIGIVPMIYAYLKYKQIEEKK